MTPKVKPFREAPKPQSAPVRLFWHAVDRWDAFWSGLDDPEDFTPSQRLVWARTSAALAVAAAGFSLFFSAYLYLRHASFRQEVLAHPMGFASTLLSALGTVLVYLALKRRRRSGLIAFALATLPAMIANARALAAGDVGGRTLLHLLWPFVLFAILLSLWKELDQ